MRAIGLLRFAIVAASAFALAPPARAGGFHIGKDCAFVLVDDDDCTLRLRARHQGSTWKIRAEGCFEISADENDIVEIPLGGYFRAEERRLGRTRRSIEIRRGTGGVLERRYVRDGKPAAFDDEAREWMVQALRTVFRHTDFGRDKHIERVLERDGIDAALDEIAQIDSDHRSRKAYERLVALRPGDPTLLARIPVQASGRVDSSHEMAELLIALAENPSANPTSLTAAADAALISSDYERRRVLVAIMSSPACDAAVAARVLRRAADFSSDHECTELLIETATKAKLDEPLAQAYFDVVENLGSDYECARALRAVIDRGPLAIEVAEGVAEASNHIGSDYHKAEVLVELASRQPLDGRALTACLRAARSIGSDYHRGRVLEALHAPEES